MGCIMALIKLELLNGDVVSVINTDKYLLPEKQQLLEQNIKDELKKVLNQEEVEYSNAKQRLQNFFNNEVAMYVLPDIDRLTNEIRPDPNNKNLRGCTVPLAMMLFAIIDLFGFLMRDSEKAKKTETIENFQYLFSQKNKYFPKIYADNFQKIVKLFRHGLIHQFFPKASGITKAGPNSPLIFESDNIPHLNVDILSKDLVKAISQIKEDINKGKDKKLIMRMNKRLNMLAEDDYKDLNKLNKSY